jgi:S-adenosylmethionine synthetase
MILIEPYQGTSVAEHRVEIVERKGTGHPDYLCDSMMEAISIALSKEYVREFGTILHHNIDKGLLAAGRVEKRFGGGRVLTPMELIIGDRATFSVGKKKIPVADIAVDASQEWLKRNMRFVDPKKHVKYRVVLAPGSEELTDIFSRSGRMRGANDTSAAVGYYPLSPCEQVVIGLERYLNSNRFKRTHPETGEDIKVMGLRTERSLDLTVAMPLICRYIRSEEDYFERKEMFVREMRKFVMRSGGFKDIRINYNTLDEKGRGLRGVYLTLLGTSAEDADSGPGGAREPRERAYFHEPANGHRGCGRQEPGEPCGKDLQCARAQDREKTVRNYRGHPRGVCPASEPHRRSDRQTADGHGAGPAGAREKGERDHRSGRGNI